MLRVTLPSAVPVHRHRPADRVRDGADPRRHRRADHRLAGPRARDQHRAPGRRGRHHVRADRHHRPARLGAELAVRARSSGACCTGIPRSGRWRGEAARCSHGAGDRRRRWRCSRCGAWSARQRHVLLPAAGDILETFADTWLFERVGSDVVPSPDAARRSATGSRAWSAVALGARCSGCSPTLRRAADPIVQFLRAIPPPALIPFGILVLGVGNDDEDLHHRVRLRVAGPAEHDRRRRRRRADAARDRRASIGSAARDRLRDVVLPAAAPQIFAGMRTACRCR